MKSNPRPGRSAFTLIELLAVITIIVILASLVVAGMAFVTDRQNREKAKVQIALISKALDDYKLEFGQYPLTGNSTDGLRNSAEALYIPLFYEGYDYSKQSTPPADWSKTVGTTKFPKATRIFVPDLDPTSSKQGWVDPLAGAAGNPPATTIVKDPWGNEYRYRSGQNPGGTANADTQNPDFDLWSAGKDGKSMPAASADKSNRDDIKNF